VCPRDALEQSGPCRAFGDEQGGFLEPSLYQSLFSHFAEAQIEHILGNTARASGAWSLGRVTDIHDDPKTGAIAGRRRWSLTHRVGGLTAFSEQLDGTQQR